MATKDYTTSGNSRHGVRVWTWDSMATGDDGRPVSGLAGFATLSMQLEGTATSVPIQGRNRAGGAWATVITAPTAAGVYPIPAGVDEIRPVCTTGTAVIATLVAAGRV